jgi:hypothetical protein
MGLKRTFLFSCKVQSGALLYCQSLRAELHRWTFPESRLYWPEPASVRHTEAVFDEARACGDLRANAISSLTDLVQLWNLPKEAFKSLDAPRVAQSKRRLAVCRAA